MANLLPKCLVIVACLLVIPLSSCGDLETELASLTISPSSDTIGINQSQLFTVSGKDSLGFIVGVTPSWSVTGGIGTITSSGLFTAGASTGEGSVVASYGGKSASASVTVTDKGWVEGKVTDSKGLLVPSLKVYLSGTSYFDFTDSKGDYSIFNVSAGTYDVWTTENDVYRAASREVTVGSGETVTANFTILYFTDPPDLTPPELEL